MFVANCFPHHGYIWNYGAIPQVKTFVCVCVCVYSVHMLFAEQSHLWHHQVYPSVETHFGVLWVFLSGKLLNSFSIF